MPVELVQLDETRIPELAAILKKQFALTDGHCLLDPAVMRWKYFQPRPDWEGSRSYALVSGTRILAQAAVCPIHFPNGIRSALVIDWVSAVPGAGTEVFKHFFTMFDVMFGESGSSRAQKIIQVLGFPQFGTLGMYSRALHPLETFRHGSGLKRIARLGRDLVASNMPRTQVPGNWSVEKVSTFPVDVQAVCAHTPQAFHQPARSAALLNYFLACPVVKIDGYLVREGGEAKAYYLLADLGKEVRLADIRVASESVVDWANTVGLMLESAERDYNAGVLLVPSSVAVFDQALEQNRFRRFQENPLYLYDPQGRFPKDLKVNITPFDGDQAYM